MNGLNKTMMFVSLIFEIICLIASIWISTVLNDGVSYLMIVIFAIAVVATFLTIMKSKQ